MIVSERLDWIDAAVFYTKALGIDTLEFSLAIETFRAGPDDSISGWIDYAEKEAKIHISDTLDAREDEFEILAHEMVHLKQYLLGELEDGPFDVVFWKGVAFDSTNNPEEWRYWQAPWEMEAFGRQQGLNYMRQVAARDGLV